jgi:hypothetical protein
MANYVLSLYDKDMKLIKTTELEITKYSELAGSAFSGKYFLFVFADATKKTRSTFILDNQGNVSNQKVEKDVPARLLTAENFPDIHVLNEAEFLLVRAEKDKKFGYQIERVDTSLNTKWAKTYVPEKGIWSIEDSKMGNGTLYLLRDEKPNALWGDKHRYAVQGINIENGELLFTTELSRDGDMGFPSFIRVGTDGTVATGGMYFNDGNYDEKNSDGFFFALINGDGSMRSFMKSDWKKVRDEYKDAWVNEFIGGKTRILVEDVLIKKDGTYMIIAEAFRKSMNPSNTGGGDEGILRKASKLQTSGLGGFISSKPDNGERGFTVMDFVFMNFDNQGKFTGISKVSKTSSEAVIRGSLARMPALAMAQALSKRKFFSYREVVEVGGKQYIMFKNVDGLKRKAYFLPVGNSSVEGIGSIDMDKWASEGLNSLGKFSKFMGSNKTTFEDQSAFANTNPELYYGVAPAKEGYVLLYEFRNGKMNIWLEPIPGI